MSQVVEIKSQIRNENQVAGNWLIHYRERKRSHDERRQEITAGTRERDENVGGGRPGWIAPVQQRFGEITGWCPAENKINVI